MQRATFSDSFEKYLYTESVIEDYVLKEDRNHMLGKVRVEK
jgi:hypothetical protein